jgi:DNA helicase IV
MHPDVKDEQAYFDNALEHRERARAQLDRAPDMSGDPTAAAELRRRIGAVGLADPDEGVAFGRIDRAGERLYIGKNAIWDDNNELLVINWQAPAASAFYTATPSHPQGLQARRTYRCEANRILDIDEMVFEGLADAVASGRAPSGPVLSDALLESLGRNRSGELADIVATIQAAQYEVISRPIEQLLVVQGGPGTGKTVVGLHRASWLLFNLSDRLQAEDVLVIGPNPAFVRYIQAVLPKLGDEAVVQRPISELGPRVRGGRQDPREIRKLKGDRRMIELIVRGLRNRQRIDSSPVELTIDGRRVSLDADLIAARANQLERRPHNEAHDGLREFVIQEAQAYLGRRGVLDAATLAVTARGPSARDIDNYLQRVWPKLTPQGFLLELFGTRRQLEAAAEGLLDEHEIEMLSIPRGARLGAWEWSMDDVPLLDAVDFLLNGPQRTYEHIVIDEAQDLSPMQLLSIARRSRNGWMTVLGDLAQATSPYALGSWNEVADHLYRRGVRADLAELRLGYRLPSEVHEVAMRVLREIEPGLAVPEAVRPSGHDVITRPTSDAEMGSPVVATIRSLLGTGLIGVITPEQTRKEVTKALDDEGLFWAPELQPAAAPIVVLSAEESKGLEFDNTVVVEPAVIVSEHGDVGLRALFVALTRCTRRLAIVHAAPLPAVLGLDVDEATGTPATGTDRSAASAPVAQPEPVVASTPSASPAAHMAKGVVWQSDITGAARPGGSGRHIERRVTGTVASAIAESLAATLSRLVQPALIPEVVDELARIVGRGDDATGRGGDRGYEEASHRAGAGVGTGGGTAAGVGTTTGGGLSVELPAELVERVSQAVAEGAAENVGAYIAAALEDKGKLDAVSARVEQLLADAGGPLSDNEAAAPAANGAAPTAESPATHTVEAGTMPEPGSRSEDETDGDP